ncbi:MAG: alpha/beta hydrolase [Oscillospiraceae bacterium]|nr:alpha/beta hydrolase [Oscillospiraceae bacterium]
MPYIEVKGLKTNYIDEGSGECILFLHGWGANLETFRPVINYFETKNRVVALDMPGCGKTDVPQTDLNMTDYADFVNEFCKLLNVERPVIVGHSNGGRTILKLFEQNPEYPCKKVILIDASGIKHKRTLAASARLFSYKTAKAVLSFRLWKKKSEPYLEKLRSHFGSSDYKNADPVMRKTLVNILAEDLKPALPNIKVPTLIFWGSKDTDTPLSDGKTMEKLIPDSGLIVLEGAGHYSYLEKLGEFLRVSDYFING